MLLVLHKSTIEDAKRNQRHHHHWISSTKYDQTCNRKDICRIPSRKSRRSFLLDIQSQLSRAKHLDAIWDEYIANSLKATTGSKQGQGARRGMQPSSQIPCNWQQFLWSEENKQELFQFLAQCTCSILHEEIQVIKTKGKDILRSPARNNTS